MAKRIPRELTDAEIDRRAAAGRAAYERERAAGLVATEVQFDRDGGRFVLELSNGYLLGVPVTTLPHLATATAAQLRAVEVSPGGLLVRVPALDADYSVAGLVLAFSSKETARRAGKATSSRKKLSSSANGKKGGRPRKLVRA